MRKNYVYPIQEISSLLLWACLLISQITGAQSIPDAQWARGGRLLVIMADGNITTTGFSGVTKYSLTGDVIWSVGPLKGGNYIGGQFQGHDYEYIREITAAGAAINGGLTVAGPLSVRQSASVPVRINANGNNGQQNTFWGDQDIFGDSPRDLIGTPDGGFIILHSVTHSDGSSSDAVLRKYNAGKQLLWAQQIDYPNPNPPTPNLGLTKGNTIINTPDGGYLIAGYFNAAGVNNPEKGWMAKLDGNGNVLWQKLVAIPALNNAPGPGDINSLSTITDAIPSTDGTGYALVGLGTAYPNNNATVLVEIDFNGNVRPGRAKAIDIQQATNAYITPYTGSNGKKYYAVGNSVLPRRTDPQILLIDPAGINVVAKRVFQGPGESRLINIATAGDGSMVFVTDNNQLVKLQPEATTQPPVGALTLTAPTYNCSTGAFTFNTTGGDGSPIEYMAPGITGWTTNPNQFVDEGSRTALDVQPFTLTARQNGITVTYIWDLRAYCNGTPPPPPVNPPTGGALTLTAPTYNCTTGAFTFNTSGGDVSTIEYMAPGITGWTTNPNQFVDEGSRTANDVQPFTLTARQNGITVTYIWDLRAYCNGTPPPPPVNPPTGGALTLTAPTYNCSTGAFTFNTTGGNGTTIEYMAPGITGWTTNPNQFVDEGSRTANDVQPFTLSARQSGVTVTYVWNLKAACGRARTAALPEPGTQLRVRVLGNPIPNQTAEVDISGAEHQVLQLNLVDLQGRVLHQQRIQQAESTERVSVPMGERSGVFLLNVSTSIQHQQVKLVKP
jgi:hypothetical protein